MSLTKMKKILANEIFSGPGKNPSNNITLRSDPLSFLNRSGRRIAGFYDHLESPEPPKGLLIIVPAYGRTKSNNLTLAYHLALNGFQVIRYDHTNHVGESEGDMLFTTLGQMVEDLRSAVDFAERKFPTTSLGLVSSSLGVRVALKEASEDERVKLFIALIGVFNLQGTLYSIYREDGVRKILDGVSLGLRDIMGFQVDADHFLNDAIHGNFHTLQTSLHDAAKLHIATSFFAAEEDPWVSLDEVRRVFDEIPILRKEIHVIPNSMHELYENPASADYACRKVVAVTEKYLTGKEPPLGTIWTPGPDLVTHRLREEKEKLRAGKGLNPEEEKSFWKKYLEKYAYIVNLQDYWNLMDLLSQLLGDWKKGERILDAGCGIGNFGTFVLVRRLYLLMQGGGVSSQRFPFGQYVGVDFIDEAIQQAGTTHGGIQREFKGRLGLGGDNADIVSCSYSILDLNRSLPFKGHCFHKICCNFVVSYLIDPLESLKELFRTLKTGGRMVVTSLKPYADLSQIYRDFIQVSRTEEELEQARLVLNNTGMIMHKEAEGYYQFFSEAELYNLLKEIGASNIQTFRAFGDQANVVLAEKSHL